MQHCILNIYCSKSKYKQETTWINEKKVVRRRRLLFLMMMLLLMMIVMTKSYCSCTHTYITYHI